jgi:hypothetical protein
MGSPGADALVTPGRLPRVTDVAPTVDPADPAPSTEAMGGSNALASPAQAGSTRPYDASWLLGAIDRLPGPRVRALIAIAALTLAVFYALTPFTGETATIGVALTYYALVLPGSLWLFGYLDRAAGNALDAFRPLLGGGDAAHEALRRELTVVPALGAWLLLVIGVAVTALAYLLFPEAEGVTGLSPAALALRFPYEAATTSVGFVLLYRTMRQLRLVHGIHATARDIDLYQPAPLYAFSGFTVRAGAGIFLLLVPIALFVPAGSSAASYAVAWTWVAVLAAVSLTAFALPLEGMHGRIAAEKRTLEAAVGRRLTATIDAIHRAVDSGDLAMADGLNKNLASLMAERDLVQKLPTWPWRPGTIGAFVTAILLPIGIWLATRLLERVI